MTIYVRRRCLYPERSWLRRATTHSICDSVVFWLAVSVVLALLLSLGGCSPLQRMTSSELVGLSPEQVAAHDKAGQAVIGCMLASGPLVNGAVVLIVLPKSAEGTIKFGVDCHPIVDVSLARPAAVP